MFIALWQLNRRFVGQRVLGSACSLAPFDARSSAVVLCGPNPALKPTAAMLASAA